MKFRPILILFLLLISVAAFGLETNTSCTDKLYLSASEIVMDTHGIFFYASGEYHRTSFVGFDENGLYVPLAPYYWVCANGHINPTIYYPCPQCGSGMS